MQGRLLPPCGLLTWNHKGSPKRPSRPAALPGQEPMGLRGRSLLEPMCPGCRGFRPPGMGLPRGPVAAPAPEGAQSQLSAVSSLPHKRGCGCRVSVQRLGRGLLTDGRPGHSAQKVSCDRTALSETQRPKSETRGLPETCFEACKEGLIFCKNQRALANW